MMKKVFALLMAALFAGGILFSRAESLFAATEEEVGEEIRQEYDRDVEELDRHIEETEQPDNPYEEELKPEDEEHTYPDEKYQDDRG